MQKINELMQGKTIAVFDLDGTIANTEPLHWLTHRETLEPLGLNLTEENIRKYVGHNDLQILGMIEEDYDVFLEDKKGIKQTRLQLFRDAVEKYNLLPNEEVVKAIKTFKGKKYIVSRQNQYTIERLLEHWKIFDYFDKIYSLEHSDESKIKLVEKLGSKDEIIWFDDAKEVVKEAKDEGFTVIAVRHTYNDTAKLEADYIIDTTKPRK
jgi:hypothetical protein